MRRQILTALAAIFLIASVAVAQDAQTTTLKVGDKAPPLGKGEWVKGEPVKEFESGKVYVIENWATWCGPCIDAIPHITELQKKYANKGLVVIGQNVWERDAAAVKPFVEKMGEKMAYRVVMDDPSGSDGYMAKSYLQAAGQEGIPAAFVIDQQGKIAWIGHPMAMAPVLEKVIAGNFDPAAEAAKDKQMAEASERIGAALQAGDMDGAMKAADDLVKLRPEMAGQIAMFKFNQYAEAGKWDEAYKQATMATEKLDEPESLNQIAWMIVDPESELEKKDLDVAMKAAVKANDLSKGENAAILDTLARVHFAKGDKMKAIELQKKAISKATDDEDMKEQLEETLAEYQK